MNNLEKPKYPSWKSMIISYALRELEIKKLLNKDFPLQGIIVDNYLVMLGSKTIN